MEEQLTKGKTTSHPSTHLPPPTTYPHRDHYLNSSEAYNNSKHSGESIANTLKTFEAQGIYPDGKGPDNDLLAGVEKILMDLGINILMDDILKFFSQLVLKKSTVGIGVSAAGTGGALAGIVGSATGAGGGDSCVRFNRVDHCSSSEHTACA